MLKLISSTFIIIINPEKLKGDIKLSYFRSLSLSNLDFKDLNYLKYLVIIIAIILIILKLLSYIKEKNKYQYESRGFLFTKHEYTFYKSLLNAVKKTGLVVFPKVRLADIIEPKKHGSTWQANFNKICSKHVDFLLCDTDEYRPQLIIELDDWSHKKADRQERDKFVDMAMRQAKIPILHVWDSKGLKEKIEKTVYTYH
ncbi:MAG TPA: hypothetical protein DG942_00010 [Ruminococcaceae bacterium]|jgi:hypothetical protein|nr:hypothetical protein [Oscillospiraceae bacterium]